MTITCSAQTEDEWILTGTLLEMSAAYKIKMKETAINFEYED